MLINYSEDILKMVKHKFPKCYTLFNDVELSKYGKVDSSSFGRYNVLFCDKYSVFNKPSSSYAIAPKSDFDNDKIMLLGLKTDEVLYICYDTEFFYENNERYILSYQITARYKEQIKSFILFPKFKHWNNEEKAKRTYLLQLSEIVNYCYKIFSIEHMIISNYDEKIKKQNFSKDYLNDDGTLINGISEEQYKKALTKFYKDYHMKYKLKVYFIAHYFNADVKTLGDFLSFGSHLSEGSVGSLTTSSTNGPYVQCCGYKYDKTNKKVFYSVDFRDTLALVNSTLNELGESVGLPKLKNSFNDYDYDISHMKETFVNQTETAIMYSCRDTEVLMKYIITNWNGCRIPPSATNVAVTMFKNYAFNNDNNALLEFRGLKKVTTPVFDEMRFRGINETLIEDGDLSRVINDLAKMCYLGGLNQSLYQGYIEEETFDYDLQGAYPTVGCVLPDVVYDVSAGYLKEWHNQDFNLYDVDDLPYNAMGLGVIDYEFPKTCYQPCIAQYTKNGLIYTLKGSNVYTDWATVRLALMLGAKVKAIRFYILRNKRGADGKIQSSIAKGYKKLIANRNIQKEIYGKKSIQEQTAKLINNGIYGKIGQSITDKAKRSISTGKMEDINESPLSSGIHATYFSAIPRLIMCAAINQLKEIGYQVYTCTTDGFISNAPYDVVNSLDLYGLRNLFKMGRIISCGDEGVWEIKHKQKNLINITTRINQGFDNKTGVPENGVNVNAAVGYKGDKKSFLKDYLKRDKNGVITKNKIFTSINEQFLTGDDFCTTEQKVSLKCNYDFKRKVIPTEITTKTVSLEYGDFDVETYDSYPYNDIKEYINVRNKLDDVRTSLITKDDLINFIDKDKVKDLKKSYIKNSLIILYHIEEYKNICSEYIKRFTRENFIKLINEVLKDYGYNKPITLDSWKNMGRSSRQKGKLINEDSYEVARCIVDELSLRIDETTE